MDCFKCRTFVSIAKDYHSNICQGAEVLIQMSGNEHLPRWATFNLAKHFGNLKS